MHLLPTILFLFLFLLSKISLNDSFLLKSGKVITTTSLFLVNGKLKKRKQNISFSFKGESPRHEIYRKRLEREIKEALESILLKKSVKLNSKYKIDEDLIEGICIYKVQLNADCSIAKVFIEVLGDSIDSKQAFIWMQRNVKQIRYLLAQLIRHRKKVPFLNFMLSNLNKQSQLFCEMENLKEHYLQIFDELKNNKEFKK